MPKRQYFIGGLRPTVPLEIVKFFNALDLGGELAMEKFIDIATVTISPDATPEQIAQHPAAIRDAYENKGCTHIVIVGGEWSDE